MGGKSAEHEISLLTGENILRALDQEKYDAVPVFLTKENAWTQDNEAVQAEAILKKIDFAFIAMHGEYGEDGRIQALLEFASIPYNGSGVAASALGMDKPKSRALFRFYRIATPSDLLFRGRNESKLDERAELILEANSAGPWVVKPAHCGSSLGVSIVREKKHLQEALTRAFAYDVEVLVEEFIEGTEVTCGILEQFSGEDLFALPPIQIIPPPASEFFDYEAKYSPETQEIIPAPLAEELLRAIEHAAREAHRILGCRGYSRTDMIVRDGTPYVLELNTLPGLTKESLVPKAAAAAGLAFPELVDHIIAQGSLRS